MSTTDLYILNAKSTSHISEFQNGWGSAPLAWDYLGAKYIAEKPVYRLDQGHLRKVWALAYDPRLSECEKVSLMMTFDRAFVPVSQLDRAGKCIIKFGEMCDDAARVNHWPAIGACLISEGKKKHTRHMRGVAMSSTSVSDAWDWPEPDQLFGAWPIYGPDGIKLDSQEPKT